MVNITAAKRVDPDEMVCSPVVPVVYIKTAVIAIIVPSMSVDTIPVVVESVAPVIVESVAPVIVESVVPVMSSSAVVVSAVVVSVVVPDAEELELVEAVGG
jgi:hypothetical protein